MIKQTKLGVNLNIPKPGSKNEMGLLNSVILFHAFYHNTVAYLQFVTPHLN